GGEAIFDVFEAGAAYLWNTGETTPSIRATQTGLYRVDISYPGTGCTATDEVELIVYPNPVVSIVGAQEVCEGETLVLYAESPNILDIISWNQQGSPVGSPDTLKVDLSQNQQIILEALDQNKCPATDSIDIEVIPYPEIDLTYDPLCIGDTLYLDASAPNIQDPRATWFWWKDQNPLGQLGPIISTTEEGSFEVIFDLRGCVHEFGTEVFFNPLPESNIYEEQLNCVYKGNYVQLDGGEAARHRWLHTQGSSRFVEVVAADTYYVEVFNEFGCSIVDSTAVVDACPPLLYVPTAFSPNGDGINEEFAWGGDYLGEFDMQIYSRWGMLLYQTNDPVAYWNGAFKGQPVQEGVYTWIVRYKGTHPDYQKTFQRAGTVTIFR
ncbi:MAG: gliding motility-associated C-terminal domain-containing protein, partial [Bacteroidota bacterium]